MTFVIVFTCDVINQNGCRISEVRIGTEEMFSEVGSESRIHPSPARAFSEGWVLGLHRLHVCVYVCVCVKFLISKYNVVGLSSHHISIIKIFYAKRTS